MPTYSVNINASRREYYINLNAQSNGDHEIHVPGCGHFPQVLNALPLGVHSSCAAAKTTARQRYQGWIVDGCKHCLPECHTR